MCVLATGSCIDLPLIIIRVIYWRVPTKINLRPLEDSVVGGLFLNILHLFILVTVPKTKGGWEGLNKGVVFWSSNTVFLVLITKQYFFQDLYFKKYTCFSTNKAEYAKLLNALVFNVDKKKRRLKIKVVICTGKNLIKGYVIRNEKLIKDSMSFDFSQYSNTIKGQYPNRVVEHFNSTVQ